MNKTLSVVAQIIVLAVLLKATPTQAQSWTNLGNGINGQVIALAFDTNGDLYAGGSFTTAGGVAANRIAKWNGSSWTNLGSGMSDTVNALVSDANGNLYAGGYFVTADDGPVNFVAKRSGSSWISLGSGLDREARTLASDANGNLYASVYTGSLADRIAKWNGSSWTNLGSGINSYVYALALDTNGNLYAGGQFTNANGASANYIAKWNGSSWTNLGSGMNSIVRALAFSTNGILYAGGSFTTAGGMAANYIAKWNGSSWTNLGSGMGAGVSALAFSTNGELYAGGSFTTAGGVAANRIARWFERRSQTITFPAIATQNVTNSLTLSATASSGLGVSFSVGSGPALINNNIATFSASGQVSIVASQAGNDNWTAAPEATNTFTVVSVPGAPTGIKASYGTYQDKVRVSWIASTGAWGYEIWRGTNSQSGLAGQIGQTTATSFDDTEAVPNVLYYYWVRATNDVGSSGFGGPDIGLRAPSSASLDAPSGVSASDGSYTNKVLVSWNAVSGALYYELWRNMSNNSSSASLLAQITNSVIYDDATVTLGVNYCYWVKAKNTQITSAFSDPDSGYAALSAVSGYADLEVSDVILLPTTLEVAGHPGAAGLQLLNWGPNDLTAPDTRVILDFFLSQNATFGDTNDLWLGDFQTDVALAAGDHTLVAVTASAREGFTVPSGALGTNYVFVRARHTYPSTLGDSDESNNHALRSGTINVVGLGVPIAGYHVFNDYDGDGKSDLALYRETTGEWSVLLSGSGYQTASAVLGGPAYQPALADYDGDGKNDLAVYHQTSGEWTFLLSASSYASAALEMGGSGYTPVAADYDGDGKADPTVYQESSGLWQILKSASNYAPFNTSLGGNGYKAVAADFDGDGQSDIAVYRRSTGDWRIMLSSLEYWTTEFQFGGSGQVPVPADYDADGKTDAAVYKDSSGEWRVMLSKFSYLTATATFGGKGYVAVPADYDGDGKGDVVVYSENAAELKILLSGSGYSLVTVNIGGPGYEPVGYYDW